MSVADRIIDLRKNQNISQNQLAKLVGVSRQAVSKWENGLSLPDSMKMILLAEVLKTDVEYLTTGRVNDAIRPPIVIKTIETVEKSVEIPVERIIEKVVEVPVVHYVEKPVVKKVVRTVNQRNLWEYVLTGVVCLILGLLIGFFI